MLDIGIKEGFPQEKPTEITREMIHEMVDLVLDLHDTENFVGLELKNYCGEKYAIVEAIAGSTDLKKNKFSLSKAMLMKDVDKFNQTMNWLFDLKKNALEAATSEGTVHE